MLILKGFSIVLLSHVPQSFVILTVSALICEFTTSYSPATPFWGIDTRMCPEQWIQVVVTAYKWGGREGTVMDKLKILVVDANPPPQASWNSLA